MVVMVALLRAVNVGGKSTLAMADLRRIAAGCGCDQVRTYIQSGNLVFSTSRRSPAATAARLRAAIAEQSLVAPEVIVRTRRELAEVLRRNPYVARGEDLANLHVLFVGGRAQASVSVADIDAYRPEEATAVGQELYLHLPSGVGRSKLVADLGRGSAPPGTMRSWRTVTKLMELADEIA
jgi:uncharacterized protein (DUF1697 family)